MKQVIFTEDARAFTSYKLKPQMRTLGPKYGKLLGKIGQHLQTHGRQRGGGRLRPRGDRDALSVDGTQVELSGGDVLTEPTQKPGFMAQQDQWRRPWCWTPT